MAKRPNRQQAKPVPPSRSAGIADVQSSRLQLASRHWNAGDRVAAMRLFAEAVRLEPNNVQAYVMKATAHAERYEFEKMEETLDRLARRVPRHPGVHHYIGDLYARIKLPRRALESYARAARLPGAGPPTWVELASLCERAHRLDEAEELLDRAARQGFTPPSVALVRCRIQRRQKRFDAAEATLRNLIQRLPEGAEAACEAWGELALMKDAQGDFDAAIDAIEQCKRGQRTRDATARNEAERIEAEMRTAIATTTREDFARWQALGADVTPQRAALLTGFPRSGTTLLEQALDAHPDLVSSEERDFIGWQLMRELRAGRESQSFIAVLDAATADEIRAQRDRYFQFMEYLLGEPIAGRLHLDKNPGYNLVVPLALRVFPEMRLLVALRDPRDVVLSCFLRYLPLNAVSVNFLDITRTAQRYALDMSAWIKYRNMISAPWCEIRYENLISDFEGQLRRALDTLSLKWDNQVLEYRRQLEHSKRVTSPSYEAVAEPLYTRAIGRWKNYEALLAPAFEILAPFVREFGYSD